MLSDSALCIMPEMGFEQTLLIAGALILTSILISRFTERIGIPSLILFLIIGMLAGSEGIGKIYFDNTELAQHIGIVALIYILFSGGMDTKWASVKPVLRGSLLLSTIGVVVTALLISVFSVVVLEFTFLQGLLLGSIVSSTDAAAVFSALRSRSIMLSDKLKSVVELESGSNDAMAVFLTISTVQAIMNPEMSILRFVYSFVLQMTLGSLLGYIIGKLFAYATDRLNLDHVGLYPVFIFAMVLFSYGLVSMVGGNGFLAVYIIGIVLRNNSMTLTNQKSILGFYDGMAWLMQIAMFIVLGLLVFPSQLIPIIPFGFITSVFLMFIARPAGVFTSLFRDKFSLREKLLVSWIGLKGALPIILAMFPLLAGVEGAQMIFNIVFFVVLTSTLIQGMTIPRVSDLLDLQKNE